ncbi:MAG: universal stress protein [Rubricoccaceae bacterium]|nr:universal stress protein [Rubricoccaceae bacterium]
MSDSKTKLVVCAVDFSEGSEAAIVQAADIAERLHCDLHLIHSDPVFHSEFGHIDRETSLEQVLSDRVREFAVSAWGSEDAYDVIKPTVVIKLGAYAGDAIVDYANKVGAWMTVIGTHGRRGVRRFIIGSVAEAVTRRSDCPVLTVPNSASHVRPGPEVPIVVPTDFSEHSRAALVLAEEIATWYDAPIHLIHVLEDFSVLPGFYLEGGLVPVYNLPTLVEYAKDHLKEFGIDTGEGRIAESYVSSGHAHLKISEYAEEIGAGCIVMATHGRTGVKHALIGSVTERTLRYAPCPVLSVRAAVEDEA